MMLSHEDFEDQIRFEDGSINLLVIENRAEMSKLVGELVRQSEGLDGGFSLFEGAEELEISKALKIIMNPFSLFEQLKDIDSGAISILKKSILGEGNYEKAASLIAEISHFINHVLREEDSRLTVGEQPSSAMLIKLMDVHASLSCDSVVESICDYVSLCKKYTKSRVYVFVNLKSFLSDCEISEFYKFAMYEKIDLLIVESSEKALLECENETIIDADLCEIHRKGGNNKVFEV